MDAVPAAEREGNCAYYVHTHAHIFFRLRIC
jgi:hypothetical protein